MKNRIALAVFAGTVVYLILEIVSYADWFWPSAGAVASVSGLATLLGLFVPALVAASFGRRSPLIEGAALGVSVVIVRFLLSVSLIGWDFAVAELRIGPAAPLILFAFCIAFTYAGAAIINRASAANSNAVT